jgi:hypothetical protein
MMFRGRQPSEASIYWSVGNKLGVERKDGAGYNAGIRDVGGYERIVLRVFEKSTVDLDIGALVRVPSNFLSCIVPQSAYLPRRPDRA